MAVKTLTAPDLINLRKDKQRSRLYLAILQPGAVFKARINQVFSAYDRIVQVEYDTVTLGAYTNILNGETLWIGTTEGAYDVGIARIRKTPTSTILYIGETSEIEFADDQYLTVVNDFGLWAKPIYIDSNKNIFMDYDIAYTDQHEDCNPVPTMGSHAVVWLTGSTVDIGFDASDSWVIGSTISSYSWSAPGSSASSGMSTATPTITYNAAGTYSVACTITAANGKVGYGFRYVFVYTTASMPVTQFTLDSCSGDYSLGGWQFRVTLYDEAHLDDIMDKAFVILLSDDWYGDTQTSIGPLTGRENIIAQGWVDKESINYDADSGFVEFEVKGPQYYLNKMTSFPAGVEDTDFSDNGGGVPTRWTEFEDLTVDMALFHFLYWRTTAAAVIDIFKTGDTRQIASARIGFATLWQQLLATVEMIAALPCCDRYMALYNEIDLQFLPTTSRSGILDVMTITEEDWREDVVIDRNPVDKTGMVYLSGTAYSEGDATAICVKAYGNIPARYGNREDVNRMALVDTASAIELAGLLLARSNNLYPLILVPLAANNRGFDICPNQYAKITLLEGDTVRGIEWAAKKFTPRRVTIRYDHRRGYLTTDVELEAETYGTHGVEVDCPEVPETDPGTVPVPDPPDIPDPPPPQPSIARCGHGSGNAGSMLNNVNQFNSIRDVPEYPKIYGFGTGQNGSLGYVSDEEYIYYGTLSDDTVWRRAITDDGTDRSYVVGAHIWKPIGLVEPGKIVYLHRASVDGHYYEINTYDFELEQESTLLEVARDVDYPGYATYDYLVFGSSFTVFEHTDGDVYIVVGFFYWDEDVNDGQFTKGRYHVYNYTQSSDEGYIDLELDDIYGNEGADWDSYCNPVIVGPEVLFFIGVEGAYSGYYYPLGAIYVHCINPVTMVGQCRAEQTTDPNSGYQCYDAVAERATRRVYFMVSWWWNDGDPLYPTYVYSIDTNSIALRDVDDYHYEGFSESQDWAFKKANHDYQLVRWADNQVWATFPPPNPLYNPNVYQGRIASIVDDGDQGVYKFDNDGKIRGYGSLAGWKAINTGQEDGLNYYQVYLHGNRLVWEVNPIIGGDTWVYVATMEWDV